MTDLKKEEEQKKSICKTPEEIEEIIRQVQIIKPQLTNDTIIKGIKTCCILTNNDFVGCVIEMATMHQLMINNK